MHIAFENTHFMVIHRLQIHHLVNSKAKSIDSNPSIQHSLLSVFIFICSLTFFGLSATMDPSPRFTFHSLLSE